MKAMDKLMRYFGLNFNKEKTIRQISIETKIPYMTLSRAVKELADKDIVKIKKQGKSIICSLNKGNNTTKHYLILASEAFKKDFLKKKSIIKKIDELLKNSKNYSAILFGSYAYGKEQKHSDVDIAFISNSKKQIKETINEFKTIEQIHDIEINTMIFTEKQFKEMLKTKEENVGKQILKNHVILHNPELLWNLVYEVFG